MIGPAGQPLTSAEVGATRGELPARCRTVEVSRRIGTGRSWFQVAVERLMTWDMHRRAGVHVDADDRVTLDGVALLEVRFGPW